jgi:NAD(P)-dependent dehydrogenase (short-subunit alcohol dehydrogenase family)
MDLGLQAARAIVTGGSSGLGLAIARGLLAEGARVALVARDEEKLHAAAVGLRGHLPDADVLVASADTTKDESVRAMVDRIVTAWGGVDVLVNAAAQPSLNSAPTALSDLTDAEVMTDFDTKVMGYLRCVRAVAPS